MNRIAGTTRKCCIGDSLRAGHGSAMALLFPMIEQLLAIRFVAGSDDAWPILEFEDAFDCSRTAPRPKRTALTLRAPATDAEVPLASARVAFADSAFVPAPFRGRTVVTGVPRGVARLSPREDETVLATADGEPLWSVDRSQGPNRFRSALPIPRVTADTGFGDVFCGGRFMELLPLLHFLRQQITKHRASDLPPLRATFIIDDPNLHGMRYGYVDYRQIAAGARNGNYHVAFATIPLDTWLTSASAARIFRENPQSISVLVHGNNHGREELAQREGEAARAATLRQAIARIERLERKARIDVARVMVPPHGAFDSQTLALLPSCGFDAACVSTGSLRFHNRDAGWTRTLGFHPCEVIEGCPVLPRWALAGNVRNALLVAAFLGQPLIVRGHQQDFKQGLALFDDVAGFINGLGDVRWSDAAALARSNFVSRTDGGVCRLTPLSLRLEFTPPPDARDLCIEHLPDGFESRWRIAFPDGTVQTAAAGQRLGLDGCHGSPIVIGREAIADEKRLPSSAPIRPALVLRRLLTEARDRLLVT